MTVPRVFKFEHLRVSATCYLLILLWGKGYYWSYVKGFLSIEDIKLASMQKQMYL